MKEEKVKKIFVVFEYFSWGKLKREAQFEWVRCKERVYVFIKGPKYPEKYAQEVKNWWNNSGGKDVIELLKKRWPGVEIEMRGNFHCTEEHYFHPKEYLGALWGGIYRASEKDYSFFAELKKDIP